MAAVGLDGGGRWARRQYGRRGGAWARLHLAHKRHIGQQAGGVLERAAQRDERRMRLDEEAGGHAHTVPHVPLERQLQPHLVQVRLGLRLGLRLGVEAKDEARGGVRVRFRAGARDGVRGRSS